jgi:hypothetical protein
MSVPLEAFLADLYLAATFEGAPEELRRLLDTGALVRLTDVTLVALADLAAGAAERSAVGSVSADEILLASLPPEPVTLSIHRVPYPLEIWLGPYHVTGVMSILPGFDPGRALTRPASYFLDVTDAEVHIETAGGGLDQPYELLSVNRFAVERAKSEIDVTFWFPGAEQELPAGE